MKKGFVSLIELLGFGALFTGAAWGAVPPVEIVMGRDAKPCRPRTFFQPLAIYRDPSLFLGPFAAYVADPNRGLDELLKERPLLTKIAGNVALREVGDARAFRSFPIIQQMYGDLDRRFLAEEAPKVIPVLLCGEGHGYRDTPGFVIASDLEQAERPAQGLPPSIEPNPVPKWSAPPPSPGTSAIPAPMAPNAPR